MSTTDKINPCAVTAAAAHNHLFPTLPFSNYISPPVVASSGKGCCISFFFGRGEFLDRESGFQIWSPSLLAIYDAQSGAFREIRGIKPSDFGFNDNCDAPIGKGVSPCDKNQAAYLDKQVKLFESCDNLLNAHFQNQPTEDLLAKYRNALLAIVDQPLWKYCERLLLVPNGRVGAQAT